MHEVTQCFTTKNAICAVAVGAIVRVLEVAQASFRLPQPTQQRFSSTSTLSSEFQGAWREVYSLHQQRQARFEFLTALLRTCGHCLPRKARSKNHLF